MRDKTCQVCENATEPLFASPSETALISSATCIGGRTEVALCHHCGHVQTTPIVELKEYYDNQYNFQMRTEDQDDLYEMLPDGSLLYRTAHQASIVGTKFDLVEPLKVLDYGCGKANTLKILASLSPTIEPYVFDVSRAYQQFWNRFVDPAHQAFFALPTDWHGAFDIVLSFFALEHVEQPAKLMHEMRALLKPDGRLLFIVPNFTQNISDLAVVDHVNHFTMSSLAYALAAAGLHAVEIDTASFRGAFVVTARAAKAHFPELNVSQRDRAINDARTGAQFYFTLADRIASEEAASPGFSKAAIYGSGIYGLYVAALLSDKSRLQCFLDQNPYKQGQMAFERKIIHPDEMPDDIDCVFVALNPSISRSVVAAHPSWQRPGRKFVYI